MADKYDYDNDLEKGDNASKIFLICGIPLLIIFFPELWKLHVAGHNFIMFLLGIGLYITGTIPFMRFIVRPVRKKVYGAKRQDFRLHTIILLLDALAFLILYIRVKYGIFVGDFLK